VRSNTLLCERCECEYPIIEGIPSFHGDRSDAEHGQFFDAMHERMEKKYVDQRQLQLCRLRALTNRSSILRRVKVGLLYHRYRHETFFRRGLRPFSGAMILDLACGRGTEMYAEYGRVVGVDIALGTLIKYAREKPYEALVHASAARLPFRDGQFDVIVNSEFFGHVPLWIKDAILQECRRVLKRGGQMICSIETDSENALWRIAKRHPDLYEKHFIVESGGHYGLELPSCVTRRLEMNGYDVIFAQKAWGAVWSVETYADVFDNEYRDRSRTISFLVEMSKRASRNLLMARISDVGLGMLAAVVDRLTPLDHGINIHVVCRRKADERGMGREEFSS